MQDTSTTSVLSVLPDTSSPDLLNIEKINFVIEASLVAIHIHKIQLGKALRSDASAAEGDVGSECVLDLLEVCDTEFVVSDRPSSLKNRISKYPGRLEPKADMELSWSLRISPPVINTDADLR